MMLVPSNSSFIILVDSNYAETQLAQDGSDSCDQRGQIDENVSSANFAKKVRSALVSQFRQNIRDLGMEVYFNVIIINNVLLIINKVILLCMYSGYNIIITIALHVIDKQL